MTRPRLFRSRTLSLIVLIAAIFAIRGSSAGTWSAIAPLPGPRYAHATAELNGAVHVVGGAVASVTCAFETSHVVYDPTSARWVSKAAMHVARVHPGAAVLNNGVKNLLYVVGGSTSCGPRSATMEAYDPDTDTWIFKASMPAGPRSTMGVAVVDNILYVVGGQQADSGPHAGITAIVEAYDPIANTWTTRRALPGVRYGMAIGAIDGLIYVAGGGDEFGVLDTLYAYDPATDLWSARAPMPAGHHAAASAVAGGRLYVVGGYIPAGFTSLVHVYDPASNSWSAGPSLPVIRTAMTAATANNLVYAVGGTDGSTPKSEAFALDDPVDTTAPATTVTSSPAPTGDGWNNSDVTIALEATDNASGVQSITYSLSGAQTGGATIVGSTAAVSVTAEGITTLTYHAVDAAGNVEADKTLTVKIDKTAPLVGAPSDIVAAATTSAGAVVGFTVSSTDTLSGVVSTQIEPLVSGSTFALGTTHETITVLDAAGNGTVVGFDVTVVPGRPNVTVNGGTFLGDSNPHPATATATDRFGNPVTGSFNVAYAPGGTAPVAPGRYSATATFISSDPAFTSLSPWTTKASDIVRAFASGGVINGRLYIVGVQPEGAASTARFRTSEFDPQTNRWLAKKNAPISRNQAGSAVVGSKLYVAGGCVDSDCNATTNTLAAYQAGRDSWSTLAPMPFARNNVAVAAIGTKLYVAGGANPYTATDNLQIYDTETNTWTDGTPLPVGVWQAAGAEFDGKLYVIGGLDGAGVYRNIVQAYDPASNTWSMRAAMPTSRIALAAVVANNRIYAIGGSNQVGAVSSAIESYDPLADAWTIESSLPTARFALVAGVIDGVLYASSGASTSSNGSGLTEALDLSLTTHITIEAPVVLESITVSPSTATLAPGATQSFLATGHFSDGSSRVLMTAGEGPHVRWESINPAVAGVNEFGLVQANTPGVVSIRASAGSVICLSTACATVTVSDVTPPTLSLPSDMTVEAFSAAGQPVTWFASATDNVDGLRVVTCDPASGSLFPFGATTVNCSASDNSGNLGTASFTITVVDTNPPWLALPNAIQTRQAMSPAGAIVTYFASANDSVDGPITPSCSPASGSQFAFGSTTVNCSATDARGNAATGSFTVIVEDTSPPFLNLPSGVQTREANNSGGASVTYTATASDTVDGPIAPICNPSSGSQFPFGSTPVNCSAMDAHGNVANGSFTVLVQDTTAPSLALPNSPQTRQATSPAGAVVTYTATANDTADGPLVPSCSPISGSQLPFGPTTVNCSATDAHGNTRSGSFTVNVVDTNAPFVFTPGMITATATSSNGTAVTFTATANDNVDGPRPVSCSPASGSIFPLGQTQVTCTATDARGNTGTGFLQVNVVPGPPAVTILNPPSDALVIGNIEVLVETRSAVSMSQVIINGFPAAFRGPTPAGALQWSRVVSAPYGAALHISVTALDAQGRMGTASRTVDNDGIAAAVDRSRTTADDQSNVYSSDFNNGTTSGTVIRSGGAHVSVFPRGSAIGTTLVYPGTAQIYACGGGPKYLVLNTPGEGADITCTGPSTVTVTAYGSAGSPIDLVKQATQTTYTTYIRCNYVAGGLFRKSYRVCFPVTVPLTYTYWYSMSLAPGQTVSTGSPVTASPENTEPIHVTLVQIADDGSEIPVGSFDLDAGESADINVEPMPTREDVIEFMALQGTVTAEVGGVTKTIGEGQTAVIPMDVTPPVLSVPANFTVNSNTSGGAIVTFDVTAHDAIDGPLPVTCSQSSGSLFAVGSTTVSCSAIDAQGNPTEASFTVTVRSTIETLQSLLDEAASFSQAQGLIRNAIASINGGSVTAACGQLGAIINMVNAQVGKKLTQDEATMLIGYAADAIAALGCQAGG